MLKHDMVLSMMTGCLVTVLGTRDNRNITHRFLTDYRFISVDIKRT